MTAAVISRRHMLVGGVLGLGAATGMYVLRRAPSGPVLHPLPVGTDPAGRDGYVVAAYQTDSESWRVLDPRTGRYVARDGSYAACSPDLRYTLVYEAAQLSRSTRVLDTGSGAAVYDFGRAWNLPLGWSRDGRHIVVGDAGFHDVHSKEDNYFTLDRVRIFDVARGESRAMTPWKSAPTSGSAPWWTTDGRLAYADRLIAMDGSCTVSHGADTGIPVLGTDRVVSVSYDGDGRTGTFLTGQRSTDVVAAKTWESQPRQLDAEWVGIDDSGLTWLAWLDDDRIIGLRDHDLSAYDVRTRTRQVLMRFPDDLVTDVLIAPAAGVPATIR